MYLKFLEIIRYSGVNSGIWEAERRASWVSNSALGTSWDPMFKKCGIEHTTLPVAVDIDHGYLLGEGYSFTKKT